MTVPKKYNHEDYMHKSSEANPTTKGDLYRYFENDGQVVEAMVDSLLWQPSTAYTVGAVVHHPDMPAGYVARCVAAGTSSASDPAWQAGTVTDGTVKWEVEQSVTAATDEETAAGTAGNKAVTPASLKSMLATDEETAAGTAENKLLTPAVIKEIVKTTLLAAHPVGSYYWSSDSTDPSKLFGGTWEALPPGYTLIAQGKGTDDFGGFEYKAGQKYGERMHKLTVGEMPNHGHQYDFCFDSQHGNQNISWGIVLTGNPMSPYTDFYPNSYSSSGGDEAHNNMQPAIATYCWKRIS